MKIKNTDTNSIFPTIIKKIKLSLEDVNKLLKLIFSILNISEFTVLVNVKIESLNDFSKPILSTINKLDKIKRLKKKVQEETNEYKKELYQIDLDEKRSLLKGIG